tara:strand:- start:679 stop:1080 length:402 start_codon:yes stop_codon:yes gene_type:complete
MSINQFALQTAVFSKLSTDSNLTSVLKAKVFDDIPENTDYPYVQLGEDTAIDYSTKDQTGSEVSVNVDVWSRYRGSLEAKNIMDRVHTLLHDSSLSVTGSNFINMRFEFSDIIRDPDGITRHGVMRFRAIMLG